MKRAPSEQEVILQLARRGDPSAFHMVFGDHLARTCDTLIKAGAQPEQAIDRVMDLGAKLIVEFAEGTSATRSTDSIDAWYTERVAKHLPETPATDLSVPPGQPKLFYTKLNLHLQRAYSAHIRAHASRNRRQSDVDLLRFVRRPWVIVALTVIVPILCGHVLLAVTGTQLDIRLNRGGETFRAILPFGTPAPTEPITTAPPDTVTVDSVAADTAAKAAVVPVVPPPTPQARLRPSTPSGAPAAARPAPVRPAQPQPSAAPPPETYRSTPRVDTPPTPAQQPAISVPEPEPIAPQTEPPVSDPEF